MIFGYRCLDCGEEFGFGLPAKMTDNKCPCGGECEPAYLDKHTIRFHLEPISGDFPGATRKWAKGRAQKIAKEKHAQKEHGDHGLWQL